MSDKRSLAALPETTATEACWSRARKRLPVTFDKRTLSGLARIGASVPSKSNPKRVWGVQKWRSSVRAPSENRYFIAACQESPNRSCDQKGDYGYECERRPRSFGRPNETR